uniref:Homing endonuclease LAGLIDADG domain-containing protein n=1 Tax=Caulerpa verticillata TaxID=177082 RepID=A0A386B0A7_9CHLO|nr:hypothetical protein [Caulerpa verticillata]AYC65093.1 hypothetical protein [Caulerpa verticillata]
MNPLNPNWIVGFVDGEGHFGTPDNHQSFYFTIYQNQQSVNVLYQIKNFFKCGSVYKAEQNMRQLRQYKVSSKKHLKDIIIPFFLKWPLKTSKRKCFEIFVKKLTPNLDFKIVETANFNIHWFVGFIDAEGCFDCSITNRNIRPNFLIGLNGINKNILDLIQQNLNFGFRYKCKNGIEVFQLNSNKQMCRFARQIILTKGFKDRLKTFKRIRARKWCKIVFLMEQKKHNTIYGFNKIQKLSKSF